MSRARQVAGGGRAVEVSPERLTGWFERFAARHGGVRGTTLTASRVEVRAEDGARAEVEVPFGGLDLGEPAVGGSDVGGLGVGGLGASGLGTGGLGTGGLGTGGLGVGGLGVAAGEHEGLVVAPLVAHLLRPRRIGLVLVRLGGCSVGVAEGGRVTVSSTDRRQVHGRNKAGGWSQQRFARRREGQAREALRAAADTAARVLLPVAADLDAVVLGGDRAALAALREDRRLGALFARAEERVLDVPEPRRSVLDEAAERARCVEVVVFESATP
ncbi:eRF1 domain-containing protein 2 [Streptoalloteichus tenebrarius]|uniref:ERF1 domain-containing protein 2 n=1 Tax=Streptoalloteichus tenebrarius (strain ATCC 17920 / DSM 40477 / JCM 4838 / CBS 697.72 / NBRC 16177 / NCIMB 11028 / NRRL B-12390 / A12253. 1 / ISP 5477) TaxID=1933 RepID=A0ABT1HP52_STRSD|nr:acVLRF1 family peptidyl-tRNA hydrolase [Streptoalloteichus tenebrarius]MCP2257290.1 eRF1 domain-containing protein 2 [Streptoalloteichus tenebrarius]BFF04199.1 acVLRF1 family peptidyl-tRNA hydrolase [Streptoalloteichus tenebrarius]